MAKQKNLVFFFLRQTADIDHISPIIWHLAEQNACQIRIMLYHDFYTHQALYQRIALSKDFRIQHVVSFPSVQLEHFTELCKSRHTPGSDLIGAAGILCDEIFKQSQEDYETVTVALDWHFDELPSLILKRAKSFGFRTCMLPHASGCLIERNHIIAEDDIGEKLDEAPFIHPQSYLEMLDFDVFPNALTATEASPHFPKERLPILGSARYCEKWVEYLTEICPPVTDEDDQHLLKIAVFPRSWRYPINWPAFSAALKMLAELEKVSIIVQHHTRENDFLDNISDNYRDVKEIPGKLRIVDYNVYSGSLIRWADISLSLCTSVSFEAVVLGKPCLELEYLHCLRSYLADTYPQVEIRSHDDLLAAVLAIRCGSAARQLTFHERQDFIGTMIHSGDDQVLQRYGKLLTQGRP